MNTWRTVLTCAATAACLSTPAAFVFQAPAGEAGTREAPPSTDGDVELDAVVESFVGDVRGGAVVLVVRDGATTTATAGIANATGEPMTSAARFRVGGISNTVVATMVLQLVDDGRVDLDAPISTYLPDTPAGGDVTVRALLRHRSGLPDYFGMSQFFRDMLSDRSRAFTPEDLLGYIAPYRPGEPDRLFVYSNTNYLLLGQLIEHVDATDLNTALRNRISGPLRLDTTHFALAGDPAINGLAGAWYPGIGNGDPATDYDSIVSGAWAAGALVSTAEELHTFLAALVAGDLISEAALTEMTAFDSDGVGLGLFAITFASNRVGYGNTGEIYGYVSVMAIEPRTGDTLVILTNNDELDTFELANQILANW